MNILSVRPSVAEHDRRAVRRPGLQQAPALMLEGEAEAPELAQAAPSPEGPADAAEAPAPSSSNSSLATALDHALRAVRVLGMAPLWHERPSAR